VALSDRLKKLEAEYGPELCVERFCLRLVTTELILHPDGRKERIGDPPPELCASCPERSSPTPRVRHVVVVLDRRGAFGVEPSVATREAPAGPGPFRLAPERGPREAPPPPE
jgi:hypothetical protein